MNLFFEGFIVPKGHLLGQEGLEDDEAAAERIWDPLMEFLRKQRWFERRKHMDHIFLFADGQSLRSWDSYDLVRSDAIFMMVERLRG